MRYKGSEECNTKMKKEKEKEIKGEEEYREERVRGRKRLRGKKDIKKIERAKYRKGKKKRGCVTEKYLFILYFLFKFHRGLVFYRIILFLQYPQRDLPPLRPPCEETPSREIRTRDRRSRSRDTYH